MPNDREISRAVFNLTPAKSNLDWSTSFATPAKRSAITIGKLQNRKRCGCDLDQQPSRDAVGDRYPDDVAAFEFFDKGHNGPFVINGRIRSARYPQHGPTQPIFPVFARNFINNKYVSPMIQPLGQASASGRKLTLETVRSE